MYFIIYCITKEEFLIQTNQRILLLSSIWKPTKNKSKTADDLTGLSLKFLSLIIPVPNAVEEIVKLFNNIIRFRKLPCAFKTSTIVPLINNKKASLSEFANIRPIFLLPELAKLFERVIYNQPPNLQNTSKFFNNCQFGFRASHGTEHVIMIITETALKVLNEKKICIIVTLDLRRAFPSVNRKH